MLQLLKNAAKHGVKIRILINESAKERIERELSTSNSDLVDLHFFDKQQIKVMMLLCILCLTVEVKDSDENVDYDSTVEVPGLATYSNSESTVLSYVSIFETLWIQAELNYKKLAIREYG
jgi:two-component system, OmpR family, sensor histidine kinase VicK